MGTISPRELLAEHFAGTPARVVGNDRRTLAARGMSFATVGPDPAMITPVCAVSARDLPVVDVLAALASQDPTGVLVIETQDDAFAFEVDQGRLRGARGVGPLDQLESFVAEVHRRHPKRLGTAEAVGGDQPAWMQVVRDFVEERVLDQLELARVPGTRMTLVRGDVQWLGMRLPAGVGPPLGHVLLEHARRFDELPKLLAALGDLDRLAVPLAEPGDRPTGRAPDASGREWDFFTDPDPAALAEWNDALVVWSLCDGESSLGDIVDAAMLGHFRGLLALRTLVSARCIVLIEPVRRRRITEPATHVEAPPADVIQLRTPVEPEHDPGISATGYSIVSSRTGRPRARVEVTAPPPSGMMTPPYGIPVPPPAETTDPASSGLPPSRESDVDIEIDLQPPVDGDASRRPARGGDTAFMIVLGAVGVLAVAASIAGLV